MPSAQELLRNDGARRGLAKSDSLLEWTPQSSVLVAALEKHHAASLRHAGKSLLVQHSDVATLDALMS